MEGVIQFFERLNEELYKENLDYLSSYKLDEEVRNRFLIKLHIIMLTVLPVNHANIEQGKIDEDLSTRLMKFLTQLRLSQAMKYGNAFIRPNYISLQTLKILQLDKSVFCQLNDMSDEDMKSFLIKYLDNDCFYNDNNDVSGGDYQLMENVKCRKCEYEKIEIHESFEGKLNVCARCCYSWKC